MGSDQFSLRRVASPKSEHKAIWVGLRKHRRATVRGYRGPRPDVRDPRRERHALGCGQQKTCLHQNVLASDRFIQPHGAITSGFHAHHRRTLLTHRGHAGEVHGQKRADGS
ncbi:Uncharacterised protein [Mycobacteroides abscessus subsp. abscessus]|nr:Uncharacterised protein [Mycobacteroides abscessus subsp. abscessus]